MYRKLTKEEWAHGSLLILNELFVYANPDFENVRSSLDNMLGQVMVPIFYKMTEYFEA